MLSLLRQSCFLTVIAGVLAACSSAQDGATSAPPAPTTEPPQAETRASIHFFSERDGFTNEVQSIVYSDQLRVRLDGLPPNEEVSLVLSTYSPASEHRGYTSETVFVADAGGRVDTGLAAPVRGGYEGVDPDGIVWSAKEGPLPEGLGPDRIATYVSVKAGDTVLASAVLGRTLTSTTVSTELVTEDGLVAELFMPADANDKVPIVAFGGSEGGIRGGELYAARLASWGHPVLAVAYFGMQGLPSDLTKVPLEYFGKAFSYLDGRPETRKGKYVVMGGSRGGELALLLGATFPSVVGVIADTPSSHRWAGLSLDATAAWTFEGKDLPFVPSSNVWPSKTKGPAGKNAWVLRSSFESDMQKAAPADLEAARIEVEKTNGAILMFGGSDDSMWPACDFIDRARAKLEASGHLATHQDEGICFPDAGHSVTSIGLPTTDSMWAMLGSDLYALGGTAAANAHAGRARDAKVRAFLERVTK